MFINATQVKIKPDFVPVTTLALTWTQLSNGNWTCTDRGASNDQYDTTVRFYGTEDSINTIINLIEANRNVNNILTLSGFNSQEHIFGADLDYTGSITATAIMQGSRRAQKTWRGFELNVKLSCLSSQFTGGSGSLPILRFLETGYDADSDYTINKYDSYNRTFSYQDHRSDYGTFTGIYTFEDQEMIQMRRYVATQRSSDISIPNIIGVQYPFGRRFSSYPINVKILSFEDQGMATNVPSGRPRWMASIKLGEVI